MSCTVTREASGRGLESSDLPTHLWTARGPAPCCGKPVTPRRFLLDAGHAHPVSYRKPVVCSRQVVTNHVKLGASRVGSDRLRYVGEARHSHR